MTIRGIIRRFILENYLYTRQDNALLDNDSFLDKGLIDSMGVLELVIFLEDEFEVAIAHEELIPENLDSIDRLVAFVGRKLLLPSAAKG